MTTSGSGQRVWQSRWSRTGIQSIPPILQSGSYHSDGSTLPFDIRKYLKRDCRFHTSAKFYTFHCVWFHQPGRYFPRKTRGIRKKGATFIPLQGCSKFCSQVWVVHPAIVTFEFLVNFGLQVTFGKIST